MVTMKKQAIGSRGRMRSEEQTGGENKGQGTGKRPHAEEKFEREREQRAEKKLNC